MDQALRLTKEKQLYGDDVKQASMDKLQGLMGKLSAEIDARVNKEVVDEPGDEITDEQMVTAGAVLEKALEEGPDPFPQLKAPSKSKISRKRKVRTNKHDKGRGKGRSARKCRCKVDPQKRLREFPDENFFVTGLSALTLMCAGCKEELSVEKEGGPFGCWGPRG